MNANLNGDLFDIAEENKVGDALKGAANAAKNIVTALVEKISGAAAWLKTGAINILNGLKSAAKTAAGKARGAADAAGGAVKKLAGGIKATAAKLIDTVKDLIAKGKDAGSAAVDKVKELLTQLKTAVVNLGHCAKTKTASVAQFCAGVLSTLGDKLHSLVGAVKSGAGKVAGAVSSLVHKVIGAVKSAGSAILSKVYHQKGDGEETEETDTAETTESIRLDLALGDYASAIEGLLTLQSVSEGIINDLPDEYYEQNIDNDIAALESDVTDLYTEYIMA